MSLPWWPLQWDAVPVMGSQKFVSRNGTVRTHAYDTGERRNEATLTVKGVTLRVIQTEDGYTIHRTDAFGGPLGPESTVPDDLALKCFILAEIEGES